MSEYISQRTFDRFEQQVQDAVSIIIRAGRPVKFSYIEHELNAPVFRGLEARLRDQLRIKTKRHRNNLYYMPVDA